VFEGNEQRALDYTGAGTENEQCLNKDNTFIVITVTIGIKY